jgi:hypothetical protein
LIEAFTIYKYVICETSNRSKEFDLYLQDIIDISSKYKGNVFYQYHKAFAMKIATIKLTRGLTVDWSIRDEQLYETVCRGYPIHVCAHCVIGLHGSTMGSIHVASALRSNYVNNSACNRYFIGIDTNQSKGVNSVDTYGRPKLFYKGPEVCNNFLAGSCVNSNFKYAHVATTSTGPDMSQNASLLPVNGVKKQFLRCIANDYYAN